MHERQTEAECLDACNAPPDPALAVSERAQIPFLSGLDEDAADAIRSRMTSVAVAGGRTLFREGDEADALYTLVSGSVGLSTRDPRDGSVRRLFRLAPPDSVGELALLAGEPRSVTATALRDSHLLRLPRAGFEDLITRHPGTLLYFARILAKRLTTAHTGVTLGHAPRSFALMAVTEGLRAAPFGERLAHALDAALPGRTGCLTEWPPEADEAWFHRYEQAHDRTVFVAHRIDCPWCQLCLRHADHVLLLAEPGAPPRPGAAAYLASIRSDWIRMDLAVAQPADIRLPRPLHPEVAALPFALRLQVRENHGSDFARLARIASGHARALVLGGGGARGLAHLGVLRVLAEAGLDIDLVGGTSMGSILAASVAMDLSLDEIETYTVASFVGRNPLNDYTLPFHALTRGAKVDAGLAERFGDARIEDLWRPFFCVSSNLTTGTAMVHRVGALDRAIRASIAIPGLLPPVASEDGILVDGGMMNNLPADVMADLDRGPVLAVDVGSDSAFQAMPRRGMGARAVRRILGISDQLPGIAHLLLRSATVSSGAQTIAAVTRAAILLKPALAGVDLRAWSSFETTAELGYRCAREALETGRLRAWT
ncbi:patatin-like phospholipase family protein [Methylorubrum populi]|jgi:NTE family protein|uniref:NTE family protein n=1 Tax=Methylobacterium brachiatum TaxID=269660 RepID=A0AAJ1WW62_9HYPH|nr:MULTISPECIES: patatin-like phospholipase family protein [Methylobacterium]MCB4802766.1 patatin-like phospholipase family protein [Methylobacterium brachiatum]MDQ0543400.1 NTE family protein [Methylobacterium brachiatum]